SPSMNRKSSGRPPKARRTRSAVRGACESIRSRTTRCRGDPNARKYGTLRTEYPPPNSQTGRYTLITVAAGSAARQNRNSVPPLLVPISSTRAGRRARTRVYSPRISARFWSGLKMAPGLGGSKNSRSWSGSSVWYVRWMARTRRKKLPARERSRGSSSIVRLRSTGGGTWCGRPHHPPDRGSEPVPVVAQNPAGEQGPSGQGVHGGDGSRRPRPDRPLLDREQVSGRDRRTADRYQADRPRRQPPEDLSRGGAEVPGQGVDPGQPVGQDRPGDRPERYSDRPERGRPREHGCGRHHPVGHRGDRQPPVVAVDVSHRNED